MLFHLPVIRGVIDRRILVNFTVDPEAGLVYLPVETPTLDEYGANRPGNNLFAESLVAVELKTGKRKWHFQPTLRNS